MTRRRLRIAVAAAAGLVAIAVVVNVVNVLLDRGGEPTRACRGAERVESRSSPRELAVGGDGRDNAIYLVDVDRESSRTLVSEGSFRAWSPEGRRFIWLDGREFDLHLVDVAGSNDHIVASGGLGTAAWCPDGTQLALDKPDADGLRILDLTNGQSHSISDRPKFATDASWSSDGKWIVAGSALDGIWLLRADGTQARQLSKRTFDFRPAWSPDGKWIAYTHSDKPGFEPRSIVLVRPDGSGYRRLTDGFNDNGPTWSPDGKSIAFERQAIQYRGEPPEVRHYHVNIVDVATGKVVPVTTPNGRGRFPFWRPLPSP